MRRDGGVRVGVRGLGEDVVDGIVVEDLRRVRLNVLSRGVDEVERGLEVGAQDVRVGAEARDEVFAAP